MLQLRNGSSREAVYNGFVGSAEFAALCQNAGITVGGAIADNGTTGRVSTGERVLVQVDEYVNGVYGRSNTFYLTEGEIHNLNDDILLYPGSSTTVEADTFVAYEGAVGKINFIGNIVLD